MIPENREKALLALRGIDPIKDTGSALDALQEYMRPVSLGGSGARIHQFTINGLTYPFVRHYGIACVPDPFLARRYDMYAALELVRPGDLLVFFQSDPQPNKSTFPEERRGLRGVWVAESLPFRAPRSVKDETGEGVRRIGHTILATCPHCGSVHGSLGKRCGHDPDEKPAEFAGGRQRSRQGCGNKYEGNPYGHGAKGPAPHYVLSSWLKVAPLWLFESSVTDERVYADFGQPGMVWIGRHDNAMGPGKGSSIRQLLPEEAVRIISLLAQENRGRGAHPGLAAATWVARDETLRSGDQLKDREGRSIHVLPRNGKKKVAREDELYLTIAAQLQAEESPLFDTLRAIEGLGDIGPRSLEYASVTFPWGYTAGAADVVAVFSNKSFRDTVLIFECKKDTLEKKDALQLVLYAERVAQVLFQASSLIGVSGARKMRILPVLVGSGIKQRRESSKAPTFAVPPGWARKHTYWLSNVTLDLTVDHPRVLAYSLGSEDEAPNATRTRVEWEDLKLRPANAPNWMPPEGAVGIESTINELLNTF